MLHTLGTVGLAYVNGELLEEQASKISIFDHGFVTGDGVFESVLVHRGRPFALRRHLDRLERSASLVGIQVPPRVEIEKAVLAVVGSGAAGRAKVRVTVTAGAGPLSSHRGTDRPTLVVAMAGVEEADRDGAVVELAPWPRNERGALVGSKTTSYAENVVALAYVRERGCDEAVFANLAGNLCEGTGSNIFVVVDGVLVTPPLSSGCLAGVTRSLVVELTGARETDVGVSDLGRVGEAFLTSTTRGVQPVHTLAGRRLQPCPGLLSAGAARAFEELLERDLDP
ncbi:MAG: aminotransferase class IV [Acidimicrobiales bacterium]